MEKDQQKSGHLVLVMLPFQGHMTPMFQLATILHSKGFSTTIIHPDLNSPNPSNHPEFTFVPIPYRKAEAGGDTASLVLSFNKNSAETIRECIEKIILHQKDSLHRITGILYDSCLYCAQTVADDLRLPGISVRTGSAATLLLLPDFPHPDGQEKQKAMEKQQKSGHLVFVMLPYQGHITPMVQLAAILHSKGFSITIIHPDFNSPNPSNHPEFTFIPIPYTQTETDGGIGSNLRSLNKNSAEPIQKCIKEILHQKDSLDQISAIIYDSWMFCAQTIADDLRLPGICLRTGPAATLLVLPVIGSVSENETLELQPLQLPHVRALLSQHFTEETMEVRIGMTNGMKRSSSIILNTMDFLEQAALSKIKEIYSAPTFTVGPFHKLAPKVCSSILMEDANCISWLNKQAQKSVIYVSFGSFASIDEQELIETAWGLANSKIPFLWVIRPGLVRGSDQWLESLPNGFKESVGERGCIVKWAPQKEVLTHAAVGGFWSHCGWNSTMESICEGVPILCRPFYGDQPLNTNYICDVWKVGLKLQDKWERGDIEEAIKRLMIDAEGEEMRKKAMELKEKAALCLQEEGSSYCSLNELTRQISSV